MGKGTFCIMRVSFRALLRIGLFFSDLVSFLSFFPSLSSLFFCPFFPFFLPKLKNQVACVWPVSHFIISFHRKGHQEAVIELVFQDGWGGGGLKSHLVIILHRLLFLLYAGVHRALSLSLCVAFCAFFVAIIDPSADG